MLVCCHTVGPLESISKWFLCVKFSFILLVSYKSTCFLSLNCMSHCIIKCFPNNIFYLWCPFPSVACHCFPPPLGSPSRSPFRKRLSLGGSCHRTDLRCLKGMKIWKGSHWACVPSRALPIPPPTLMCSLFAAHDLSQAKSWSHRDLTLQCLPLVCGIKCILKYGSRTLHDLASF